MANYKLQPKSDQFAAKTDGLDYPDFPNALAALTTSGNATPFTYSETQLYEYTIEFVDKYEGGASGVLDKFRKTGNA